MAPRVRLGHGLRFGCTRCGNCCRQPGYVWISTDEMAAMAAHLAIDVDAFQASYDVQWDKDARTWRIDALHGDGCPLLDGNDCTVHPVKPAQCSSFPFWSELLDDRDAWEEAKTYCPGMEAPDGQLFTLRQIQKLRKNAETP